MGRKLSITEGMRFGKLKVLYPTDRRTDSGSVVWHTVCDCGQERDVSARRLTRGQVRSCGCLSHPPLKDFVGKTFGRLTVTGYAGVGRDLGMTRDNSENYWTVRCSCGNEKIVGQSELQNGDTRSCGCLHKEKFKNSMKLIDGTSITLLENANKIRSCNTSGKTGVSFITRDQKWSAYITFKGKRYHLGEYKKKEDAIRVRTQAEQKREKFIDWYYEEVAPPSEKERAEEEEPIRIEPKGGRPRALAEKEETDRASVKDVAVTAGG